MRYIYSILLYLLVPAIWLRLLWRSIKAPAYRQRMWERFAIHLPTIPSNGIWIHAVSVGEVQASIPLIKHLLHAYPQLPLIITTTTPTGYQHLIDSLGTRVFHIYTPYDLPSVARKFLETIQPQLAIFIETEIWPNLLHHCKQRNIPTLLANARLSEQSARGYAYLQ
ncbi:3-deoxy-D-manno-octulosonic acid transferase, partial [Achromatium sp. WMS1]